MTRRHPDLKRNNTQTLQQAARKVNDPLLASKIQWLQTCWSTEQVVTDTMQTEAIIGLYMALKAMWPLLVQLAEDEP